MIQYIKQRESAIPAFAVIIPKKVVALAVMRNHFKRLIYDAVQKSCLQFRELGLTKIIITPLKNEHPLDHTRVKGDIERFLASLAPL